MKEIYCIVSGRVQMMMFRDFTLRKAEALGLKGSVRNLKNGTVEVIAQGEKEKLEAFIEYLNKGSLLSRVDKVEVTWRETKSVFDRFYIVYSR